MRERAAERGDCDFLKVISHELRGSIINNTTIALKKDSQLYEKDSYIIHKI